MTMRLDRLKEIVKQDWDRVVEKCNEVGVLPYENAVNHVSAVSTGSMPPEDMLAILLAVSHSIATSDDPMAAFEELCSWACTMCSEKSDLFQVSTPVDKEKN